MFISWSGEVSKQVALALKEWLSRVVQTVEPWMSDADLDKGTRSMTEIAEKLAGTQFGIVVVTADNQHQPWLNYEAGALSNTVDESARLWVLLFNMLNADLDSTSPLKQFQTTRSVEAEVEKLLKSINKATDSPLSDAALDEVFEVWWPRLKEKLDKIEADNADSDAPEPDNGGDQPVDEILGTVRRIERLLSQPLHLDGGGAADAEPEPARIRRMFITHLGDEELSASDVLEAVEAISERFLIVGMVEDVDRGRVEIQLPAEDFQRFRVAVRRELRKLDGQDGAWKLTWPKAESALAE